MCSQTLDVAEFLLTLHLTNPLYPFRTFPRNGLRCDLRAPKYKKFSGGACPHTPLVLRAYARTRALRAQKITPLLKILATGLNGAKTRKESIYEAFILAAYQFGQL